MPVWQAGILVTGIYVFNVMSRVFSLQMNHFLYIPYLYPLEPVSKGIVSCRQVYVQSYTIKGKGPLRSLAAFNYHGRGGLGDRSVEATTPQMPWLSLRLLLRVS